MPDATPEDRLRAPTPSADDLLAELAAARTEVGQAAENSRLLRAHVQLEGLVAAAQFAIVHGGRVEGLSAEAERIERSLGGLSVDQGRGTAAAKLAMQVRALGAGGASEETSSAPSGTDIET